MHLPIKWYENEADVEVRARMEEISILPPPEPSDFAPINHSLDARSTSR